MRIMEKPRMSCVRYYGHPIAPFTRYNLLSNPLSNRLSNPFDNRFDNRLDVCLHDTAGCQTGCTTGLTSRLSNRLYNRFHNRLYRVNGVYVIGQTVIFLPCDFYLLFSSPNLSGRRLDVYHTYTHGVALVRI